MQTTAFPAFTRTVCGLAELERYRTAGVSHVVSILDPDFGLPAAFQAYAPHRRLELRFHDVIEERPGMQGPTLADVERLLAFAEELEDASHLLVHCHAGVSRSTAATALLLAGTRPGQPAEAAFEEVARVRPNAWPNLRMIEYGDALLGRGGTLVEALAAHYRGVLARDPGFALLMRLTGREREVQLARGGG